MDIEAAEVSNDLLSNPDAAGICEVDTTRYFVGAEAWVTNGVVEDIHVAIAKIIDSTHLQVRGFDNPYGLGLDLTSIAFSIATFDGSDFGTGAYDAILTPTTDYEGAKGNRLTIALVSDSPLSDGVTIDVDNTSYVIHFEDEVSTVGEVNDAIANLVGDDAKFEVTDPGTTGTVLTAADVFASASFSGGAQPRLSQPRQLVRVNRKFTKKTSLL